MFLSILFVESGMQILFHLILGKLVWCATKYRSLLRQLFDRLSQILSRLLKFVRTTFLKLLQVKWNLTGLDSSSSHCAAELRPLKKMHFCVVSSKCTSVTSLVWTTPHKLFVQYQLNLTGMISTKSSYAYHQHPSNLQCSASLVRLFSIKTQKHPY